VLDERSGQADDDDEQVDPAQAYRDRASYAPERYMTVQPHPGHLLPEVVERLESVLRQRTPALADPQPAAAPKVSA
jgi:dTMP kinase